MRMQVPLSDTLPAAPTVPHRQGGQLTLPDYTPMRLIGDKKYGSCTFQVVSYPLSPTD